MVSLFLEIIGGLGSAASIAGFTLKDMIPFVNDPDKKELERYFSFLEGREVLVAPLDQEVTIAVIKSLESIKTETENCRLKLKSEFARHFLLELITSLSKGLMDMHKFQGSNNELLFFKTLQTIRVRFARILCLLCAAYKIDLSVKQAPLSKMVLEHAYRPR